jgi:hypothetical protein
MCHHTLKTGQLLFCALSGPKADLNYEFMTPYREIRETLTLLNPYNDT